MLSWFDPVALLLTQGFFYMRVVVMPVKQELARLETQISEVQAALESAGPEE